MFYEKPIFRTWPWQLLEDNLGAFGQGCFLCPRMWALLCEFDKITDATSSVPGTVSGCPRPYHVVTVSPLEY
jgi:hypothetical protein